MLLRSNFNQLKRFVSSVHDMNIEYLKRSFEEFNVIDQKLDMKATYGLKNSAVLVPVSVRLEKNKKGHFCNQSYFTLTKRTEHLKRHKGQVCFPGGMCDDNDKGMAETALREANEEIGIKKERIVVVGQLMPLITPNRTLVTPVIAFFDDDGYSPVINKDEVDSVFKIPTSRFISKENHEHKSFKLKNQDEYFVHYFKDLINNVEINTWGLTALICIIASSVLHSRAPEFRLDPNYDFDKQKINDYLKYNLAKNIERINSYANKT